MTEFIKTIDGEFVREDKIVSIKKTAYFDNVDSQLIIFAGISIKDCSGEIFHMLRVKKGVKSESGESLRPNRIVFKALDECLDTAIRNFICDITDREEMEEIHEGLRKRDIATIDRALNDCIDLTEPYFDFLENKGGIVCGE